MTSDRERKLRQRLAGYKAAETKGPEERSREAYMAAWTKKHGKDDAANPYSRQNWRGQGTKP
jgi:hypothetical protein